MAQILLVGAGLTNLCLAWELEQQGFFDYTIVEASERPGGLLKTSSEGGFLFDQTGHFLHVSDPQFRQFLDATLGLDNFNILGRRSFVYSHNTFVPYPFQKNLYGLPKEVIDQCIQGFIARPKISSPKSFHSWVITNFGRGLLKHFFSPYNRKLFCRSIKAVSASWTGRFVPDTTLEDLERGSRESKTVDASGYNGCFFYPKEGGVELLIKAIVAKLKNPILCNTKLVSVDTKNKRAIFEDGSVQNFKTMVSTVPLDKLLGMLPDNGAVDFKAAAEKLQCTSVVCINLGINRPNVSDKHWIYFPEPNFHFYRAGFWHNFNAVNCPPGTSAIYTEVSTMEKSGQKREIVRQSAKAQILKFLQIPATSVIAEHTQILEHAYVVFNGFREQNLESIHRAIGTLGIRSIGRFGAWKYNSMQESFQDGTGMAKELLESLNFRKRLQV